MKLKLALLVAMSMLAGGAKAQTTLDWTLTGSISGQGTFSVIPEEAQFTTVAITDMNGTFMGTPVLFMPSPIPVFRNNGFLDGGNGFLFSYSNPGTTYQLSPFTMSTTGPTWKSNGDIWTLIDNDHSNPNQGNVFLIDESRNVVYGENTPESRWSL